MSCLGNHLVYLESWQLSALTGLGALSHLDLYFLGIHQVFCRHAKPTACHLLCLAIQADAVTGGMESCRVLAALSCVGATAEFVHGEAYRFVCLFGKCAKTHGPCHEVFDDF